MWQRQEGNRPFQVSRSTYYHWKKKYKKGGYKELLRQAPDRSEDPRCIPQETIDLVLKLRKEQKIGSKRIVWYLERYHGVTVSERGNTDSYQAWNGKAEAGNA